MTEDRIPLLKNFPDQDFNSRFWSKVRITDGCWWWTSPPKDTGYGQIYTGRGLCTNNHYCTRIPFTAQIIPHGEPT